ncbi:MAG TPA: 4'-phosphopantetheinyl transferase superfamily protein [Vicinamibacterales bacterium]|nr:4'-phosphopantetheinyl transferase superfamily protein [Vicinamibacterales bacterium]
MSDTIAVWFCATESLSADDIDSCRAILSVDERARADRLAFDLDRRDFVVAHNVMRRALSLRGETAPADWRFDAEPDGKPSVIAAQAGTPPLSCNLSHTRGLVACAVGRGIHIGIDVERTDRERDADTLARRYFSPCEVEALAACAASERHTRFVELWTLKEAYVKAVGGGLRIPLDSFSFVFDGDRRLRFIAPDDPRRWAFALACPRPGYRMAFAVCADDPSSGVTLDTYDFNGQRARLDVLRFGEPASWRT